MEYLNRVLGIHVKYLNESPRSMPNYIHSRYRIQLVTLEGKEALFVYPKTELDSVNAVKKQDREEIKAGFELDAYLFREIPFPKGQFAVVLHLPFPLQKSSEFRSVSSGNDYMLSTLHSSVDPVGRKAFKRRYPVNIYHDRFAASEKYFFIIFYHK